MYTPMQLNLANELATQRQQELIVQHGLRAVRQAIGDFPLVAIGGITSTNAANVIDAGADSVAVISALFAHPDGITKATQTLLHPLPPTRQT